MTVEALKDRDNGASNEGRVPHFCFVIFIYVFIYLFILENKESLSFTGIGGKLRNSSHDFVVGTFFASD